MIEDHLTLRSETRTRIKHEELKKKKLIFIKVLPENSQISRFLKKLCFVNCAFFLFSDKPIFNS